MKERIKEVTLFQKDHNYNIIFEHLNQYLALISHNSGDTQSEFINTDFTHILVIL